MALTRSICFVVHGVLPVRREDESASNERTFGRTSERNAVRPPVKECLIRGSANARRSRSAEWQVSCTIVR